MIEKIFIEIQMVELMRLNKIEMIENTLLIEIKKDFY